MVLPSLCDGVPTAVAGHGSPVASVRQARHHATRGHVGRQRADDRLRPVIHAETRGHVVAVTIDRADRRNAVDHETLDGLAAALDACGEAVRVLVLTGAGGHFCAGADLSGVEDTAFTGLLRSVL